MADSEIVSEVVSDMATEIVSEILSEAVDSVVAAKAAATTVLTNTLQRWKIVDEQTKVPYAFTFSHLAEKPADVPQWVPVALPGLEGTIALDRRTAELLHQHDMSITLAKYAGRAVIKEMAYLK